MILTVSISKFAYDPDLSEKYSLYSSICLRRYERKTKKNGTFWHFLTFFHYFGPKKFRNWGGRQVKSCYNIHVFNLKPTCHLWTFLVVTYMKCNYLILSLNDMCPFPYQGCHFLFLRAKYQLDGICYISIFVCLCETVKMRYYSILYATFIFVI